MAIDVCECDYRLVTELQQLVPNVDSLNFNPLRCVKGIFETFLTLNKSRKIIMNPTFRSRPISNWMLQAWWWQRYFWRHQHSQILLRYSWRPTSWNMYPRRLLTFPIGSYKWILFFKNTVYEKIFVWPPFNCIDLSISNKLKIDIVQSSMVIEFMSLEEIEQSESWMFESGKSSLKTFNFKPSICYISGISRSVISGKHIQNLFFELSSSKFIYLNYYLKIGISSCCPKAFWSIT